MSATLSANCHSICKSNNCMFHSFHLAPLAFLSGHDFWEETLMMSCFKSYFGGLWALWVKCHLVTLSGMSIADVPPKSKWRKVKVERTKYVCSNFRVKCHPKVPQHCLDTSARILVLSIQWKLDFLNECGWWEKTSDHPKSFKIIFEVASWRTLRNLREPQSVIVKIFRCDSNTSRWTKTRARSWRVFTTVSDWNKEPDRPTDHQAFRPCGDTPLPWLKRQKVKQRTNRGEN